MKLFSFNPKTNVAEFAKTFYDENVFGTLNGKDLLTAYAKSFVGPDNDDLFERVDLERLTEELRALWLEVFGLAVDHKSDHLVSKRLSEFTKAYLNGIGRSELWGAMAEYNRAVSESTITGLDSDGIRQLNLRRADLFDSLLENEADPESAAVGIARVANRLGSKRTWALADIPSLLGTRIQRRLGIQEIQPKSVGIASIVFGFYRGASESIQKVKLVV